MQGEGLQNNSFSVFLLDAQRVATIKIPAMYPSVPFGGIPATVVLLPPADPPRIHLVLKEGFKTINIQTHSEKNALALSHVVVQKMLIHERAQTIEFRRRIQSPQTGEACTLCYPAK